MEIIKQHVLDKLGKDGVDFADIGQLLFDLISDMIDYGFQR